MAKQLTSREAPSHVRGAPKGEELSVKKGKEPGRDQPLAGLRTARDSTAIRPESKGPIDPRMPHLPPA